MNLEQMKAEYELAKADKLKCQSNIAKEGIGTALYNLKKKIDAEEIRVKNDLKKIEIAGREYLLPRSCGYSKKNVYAQDDVLYFLEEDRKTRDGDGYYHWHHFVWIPQSEYKYVNLCVRTLGGDRYGDRFFLSAYYYKHPADQYSYLSKELYAGNRTYQPYVKYIIDKLGLEFNKDSREANALKWKENNGKKS